MIFRDLNKQYKALKQQIDEAVSKVTQDCNFISGIQVSELEVKLAEYVGMKHCVTCGNGTDALELAEMVLGIGSGDAVFVPDFTFVSSVETVAQLGATPVFVDVDINTFNISPDALEVAIRRVIMEGILRPKAIVAVDLFGRCADYPKLDRIAKDYGLLLIEDAAQGFGGMVGEIRACSFGDIATTSFFPAKPLGCYGDGGAIFSNDDKVVEELRSRCVHGKSGSDKYNNVRLGRNSRLDTIQAAVLLVKLQAFRDYELIDANKIAQLYTTRLDGKVRVPVVSEEYLSSWAQYTIQLPNQEIRNNVQAEMKKRGIPTMIYYPRCMHQQSVFEKYSYNGECPVSERLCETVLSLPIHPYLTEEDVDYICSCLISIVEN